MADATSRRVPGFCRQCAGSRRRRRPGPHRRRMAVPRPLRRRPGDPRADQRAGQPRRHGGRHRRPAAAHVARRAGQGADRRLERHPPPRRAAARPARGRRALGRTSTTSGAWLRQLDARGHAPRWRTRRSGRSRASTARRSPAPPRWPGRWSRGRVRRPAPVETTYCAEVVAATYQAMGLLDDERPTNYYDPGRFWSGDDLTSARRSPPGRGDPRRRAARLAGRLPARRPRGRVGRHESRPDDRAPSSISRKRARGAALEARGPDRVRRAATADPDRDEPAGAGEARGERGGRLPRRHLRAAVPADRSLAHEDAEPNEDMWATPDESRERHRRPLPPGVGALRRHPRRASAGHRR